MFGMTAPYSLLLIIFGFGLIQCQTNPPVVCSPFVGCMRGKYMSGYRIPNFEAFLGIPYAIPPVNEYRFANPKAYPKWSGIFNATEAQVDCIQKNYLIPNPQVTGSEDCLYLNVYRPKGSNLGRLPVMIYIHGGGWFSGSVHPSFTGPEYIMDTQKVILVTFSYRLGAMGFLSTHDYHISGNFGLKDQVLVFKWVQQNIASFGGNPKMVTIFGQSVGAVAAHLHMLSKQSRGLFHGVIALSGTANVPFVITEKPLQQARLTAHFCNITNAHTLSSAKLAKALRAVDAKTLINAGDGLKFWSVDHLTNYRPVIEHDAPDAFLTRHPEEILNQGRYKYVPLLMGGVPNEGAVRVIAIMESEKLRQSFNANFTALLETFLDFPSHYSHLDVQLKLKRIIREYFKGHLQLNDNTNKGFQDLVTDRGFHHPFYKVIKAHINTMDPIRQPLYLYNFNYTGPYTYASLYHGGPTRRNYGVVHCDDLIYLFRSPVIFPDFNKTSVPAQVSQALVNNFVHFATFRKPLHNRVIEPCTRLSFTRKGDSICDYQSFIGLSNGDFIIRTDNRFNMRRMHFWDQLLQD